MNERLIVYLILFSVGFEIEIEYNEYLDSEFIGTSNSDRSYSALLLELECCSSNRNKTIEILNQFFWQYYNNDNFNIVAFGLFLIESLKKIYLQSEIDIREYGKKVYMIWRGLPNEMRDRKPFFIMNYADDPLSWGDEKQTRQIYEELFNYFEYNTEIE